jgi:hypothetical protein
MKQQPLPGTRFVKDDKVLHIKRVRDSYVLTTRGKMTYEELATYQQVDLPRPQRAVMTILAPMPFREKVYKYFKTPAEGLRYAVAMKEAENEL